MNGCRSRAASAAPISHAILAALVNVAMVEVPPSLPRSDPEFGEGPERREAGVDLFPGEPLQPLRAERLHREGGDGAAVDRGQPVIPLRERGPVPRSEVSHEAAREACLLY